MEQVEKLKTEDDVARLKREHKYAIANLESVKKETVSVIRTRDEVNDDLEKKRVILGEVVNEIEQMKLKFAQEQAEKLNEVAKERKIVEDKIIELKYLENLKIELETKKNEIENKIKENRAVEFSIKQEKDGLKSEYTLIEKSKKEISDAEKALTDKQGKFKETLQNLVKDYG